MNRRSYGLYVLFMLLPSLIKGQAKDSVVIGLEEVVLTPQRIQTRPVQTPFSVQQMNKATLDEKVLRTTPEAMMQLNGVFVQKTNHGGGSAFLRGLTGNQVLIMVDGVRMNNSTFRYGPNQYLNTIDLFSLEKIEVVKGTGSVQYGSDALGGVIQLLTQEPAFSDGKRKWKGGVQSRWVSGDMEKTIRADWTYGSKKLSFAGGITYRNFGDLVGGDSTGKQTPSGYTEKAANFKWRYKMSADWELMAVQQFVLQQHVPVYHKVVLENFALNEMDPQQRMMGYLRLKGNTSSQLFRHAALTLSWQQSREGRNSRKNGSNLLRRESDRVNTVGCTIDFSSAYDKKWTAHSGLEFYHDQVRSTREDLHLQTGINTLSRGLYPDRSEYGNFSAYTLHQVRWGRFLAMGGARLNFFDIQISDTTLGKVSLSPSALVGNMALLYQPDARQSVYIALSSGYRAPNIDDMGTLGIVDFRYELPTGDLRPESSVHTEAGYKFASKKIKAELSLFSMKVIDIITRVRVDGQFINGYQVYRKENSEKATIRGWEAALQWQLNQSFGLSAAIAYAYGQNLTRNEPLRRVPPFNGKISMVYRKRKCFMAFESLFASKQDRLAQGDKDDNRIPSGGTPGWKVFNIYTGFQLKRVKLNGGLQNITNVDYRTHGSGINGAGRNLFISVIFNF